MKRRKVLTSASVLAGAALTGCGGGGEDGALGGDPSSQIAGYVVPANLVPQNGQYQVEVVFQTAALVSVSLLNSKVSSYGVKIGAKNATTGNSHAVQFSYWRCTSTTNSQFGDFFLRVIDSYGATYNLGNQNTTQSDNRQYLTYTEDGIAEYEWNVFSYTDKSKLVSIRFFRIPADEEQVFNTGQYIIPVSSTATHQNGGGQTKLLPKHHATSLQFADHEASCIHDATNNMDTVCLPNSRYLGHDELVPSYLAASDSEKPALKRRIKRHIDRFAKKVRETQAMTASDDHEVSHLLGNEIVRAFGGKSLMDHLNYVRDNVRTSIQNGMDQMGAEFDQFCTNRLPALSSQSMIDSTRNLLDTAENGEAASKVAGGCGVSTQLQFGLSITQAEFWPGINLGGGVRVSIGLARASRKWAEGNLSAVDTYNIGQIATKGSKLGFTFILKGFDGSALVIGGFSVDIEITANFTVIDAAWRLDSIAFDPVLDVDTRTWLGKLASRGLARLLAPAIGGTQTVAALPALMSLGAPVYMTGLGPEMGVFAGQMYSNAANLVNAGVKNYLNPLLQTMRDTLDDAGADTRTWGTFEISALRFVVANSDVNDTTIAFRGGFRYAGIGWQPGVKYIAGFGIAPNYTVPYVAPGLPKPPGTATIAGFMRVVSVADIFALYGTPAFIRATTFPWDM